MVHQIIRIFIFTILIYLNGIYSQNKLIFTDDFENGLDNWEFFLKNTMESVPKDSFCVDSGDKINGKVLSLLPGQMIGLIKGSEGWTNYRIEGDVYFPKAPNSLMGLVYNFNIIPRPNIEGSSKRVEFGSIYIKCGGSYIRVNPHYDGTAGRALYDDFKTPLTGAATIKVGEWKHFKYEVVGGDCHLFVEDMEKPKVTFNGYHFTSGRVGFRPRSAGSECWIDNIKITSIDSFTYNDKIVNVQHTANNLITDWKVIGPFKDRIPEIEKAVDCNNEVYSIEDFDHSWKTFYTDNRGCVISGKIIDFNAPERKLAYFSTNIHSDKNKLSTLKFSSRSELTIFVNGELAGNIKRVSHIFPDFMEIERHERTYIEFELIKGINFISILVNGGRYPGCGFYLSVQ